MSRKLLVNDGSGEREMLLLGTMAVGRDPRCDISDANPLLSRRHAEFEATPQGVRVRDLESRNGILVNGARVTDSILHPGDVVKIGHLTIKYVDDGPAPAPAAPKRPADDDATVLVSRPSPAAAAPPAPASKPKDEDDDKTRVIAPPVRPAAAAASAPPPVPSPAKPAPAAPPPTHADADDTGTRVMAPPVRVEKPKPADAAASVLEPASRTMAIQPPARKASVPSAPEAAPVVAQPQPAAARPAKAALEPRQRKGRMAKTSWGGRVLLFVLGLATAVFAVTAVPLQLFQGRVVESLATARATALVNWLAADASAQLSAGGSLAGAADAVAREPGVITAVILSPEGQVLSPASRATEKFDMLPGIAESPSNVFRLRSAEHDGLIEIARPFGTADRPRAGTAWVTFRSSVPAEAGSVLVMLVPALFVALAGGLIVANLISRTTLSALVAFNEDIDLAVTGQVAEVRDTLGAKPLQDLANTVNYLIARLKGAADARAAVPRGAMPSQASGTPGAAASVGPRSARLEADATFRVTSASPECADLIGVRPDALVGLHLIDAIPDKQIVDAVFTCIGLLGASSEERAVAAPEGRPYQLEVIVSQKAKDLPIQIGLRVMERARS